MTEYPNSACDAHRDVKTNEPVCIVCLSNEIDRLRAELEIERQWGKLWYFVSDEAPLAFEKIVAEWSPNRWIDQAHKLMADRRTTQ